MNYYAHKYTKNKKYYVTLKLEIFEELYCNKQKIFRSNQHRWEVFPIPIDIKITNIQTKHCSCHC